MAKLVSSIIITLDGFVAGPEGNIDMFKVGDGFFDINNQLTAQAGTALYGRGTFAIMDNYWPTAATKPNASKHDITHSAWYNKVEKIVLSTTLKNTGQANTTIIGNNVLQEIIRLKQEREKNIQIFGSPGVVRSLMQQNLIDEYRIFIAPVIIGNGKPLFENLKARLELKLLSCQPLKSGMSALHYEKIN